MQILMPRPQGGEHSTWNKTHPWPRPSKRPIHSVTHHMLWENTPGSRGPGVEFETERPGRWNPAPHPGHPPGDLQETRGQHTCEHRNRQASSPRAAICSPRTCPASRLDPGQQAWCPAREAQRPSCLVPFQSIWNRVWHLRPLSADLQNQ